MVKYRTEKGYPRPGTGDRLGEFSYIFTECGNHWYSVNKNPMRRNGCICPKCGAVVEVDMSEAEKWIEWMS